MKQYILFLFLFLFLRVYAHIVPPELYYEACEKLKKNPSDFNALNNRGHYFYNTRMYEKALHDLKKIYTRPGADIRIKITVASCYYNLYKLKKALALYKTFLTHENYKKYKKLQEFKMAYNERSHIYKKYKKYKLAWRDTEKLLIFFPKDWSILLKSAKLADKMNKKDIAISLYTKALKIYHSPSSDVYLGRLIALLIEKKAFLEAKKMLAFLSKKLDDPMPFYYSAMISKYYTNNINNFNKEMKKALKKTDEKLQDDYPDHVEAYFWKARIYFALKKYNKALYFIQKALRIEMEHPNLYRLRSQIYKKLGNKKASEKAMGNCRIIEKNIGEDWLKLFLFKLPGNKIKKRKKLLKKK